jgi:hypothetical protein
VFAVTQVKFRPLTQPATPHRFVDFLPKGESPRPDDAVLIPLAGAGQIAVRARGYVSAAGQYGGRLCAALSGATEASVDCAELVTNGSSRAGLVACVDDASVPEKPSNRGDRK